MIESLPVHVTKPLCGSRTFMVVMVGSKRIAGLTWGEPVAGGDPRWWFSEKTAVGFTDDEAVANVLKMEGYLP